MGVSNAYAAWFPNKNRITEEYKVKDDLFNQIAYIGEYLRRNLPEVAVQPITGFAMKGYYLWVRCSKSSHQGKPFVKFYNNVTYYDKFMNRRTAWINKEGCTQWSSMLDEEDRITASIEKENSKRKS